MRMSEKTRVSRLWLFEKLDVKLVVQISQVVPIRAVANAQVVSLRESQSPQFKTRYSC